MNKEQAQEINSSKNWELVCGELNNWINSEVNALVNCGPDRLAMIQQTIRILQKVQQLPQIVIERES